MTQKFKFEVVALYPNHGIKGQYLSMRAHVYIIDWDLDIRGFLVIVSKGKPTKVTDPMMTAWDFQEKKPVRFPVTKCMSSNILEEAKKQLKTKAEELFETFKFPKDFPKNYKEYLDFFRKRVKSEKNTGKKGFDKLSSKPRV